MYALSAIVKALGYNIQNFTLESQVDKLIKNTEKKIANDLKALFVQTIPLTVHLDQCHN